MQCHARSAVNIDKNGLNAVATWLAQEQRQQRRGVKDGDTHSSAASRRRRYV